GGAGAIGISITSRLAPSYATGRSDWNSSSSTVGRGTYSGWYKSIWNEIGRPEMSAMPTLFQSSSVGLSTTAQPCKNGLPSLSITSRYDVFQIGFSTT